MKRLTLFAVLAVIWLPAEVAVAEPVQAWQSASARAFVRFPTASEASSSRPAPGAHAQSIYMRTFGDAPPPHGYVRFCVAHPAECAVHGTPVEMRYWATPERLSELDAVNRDVNHSIQPATDLELYGQQEYWTLPVDRGDCEDYVLLKRQKLIERGWPANSLLITVVLDEQRQGHAVLTARTQQGDLVLDNKTSEVLAWNRTPYEFVMRQSYANPRTWVYLDPREADTLLPVAGTRRNAPRTAPAR